MLLLPNLNPFGHHFREVLDMHTEDKELLLLYAYFNEEVAKEIIEVKPFYEEPQMQHVLVSGAILRTYTKLAAIFEERAKSEQFYLLHNILHAYTPVDIMENNSIELYYRSSYDRIGYFFRLAETRQIAAAEFAGIAQQYQKIFAYIV